MKIGLFNSNAPKLINGFEAVLNQIVDGECDKLDLDTLKTNLETAAELTDEVQNKLNKVNAEQLKSLRQNAKAGSAFGKAVENAASLSHIVSVLKNMVDDIQENEESIDDILGEESTNTEPQQAGDENPSDENEDDALDNIIDENKNGSSTPIDAKETSARQTATDEEAAVAAGDDISNALKNFSSVTKAVTKQPVKNSNSGFNIPVDFLK